MDEKQFNKLLSTSKHIVGRYPNIKGMEKEDLVYDVLMYLDKWNRHFENKGKILTRKQLISIGWNYIKPQEPPKLGKLIKLDTPDSNGFYSI